MANSVDGLCMSFNGGKDSTVVFHLLRAVIANYEAKLPSSNSNSFQSIRQFWFDKPGFAVHSELVDFISETERRQSSPNKMASMGCVTFLPCSFAVKVEKYDVPIKEGMAELVKEGVKSVLMGTRSTDPYSGMTYFMHQR